MRCRFRPALLFTSFALLAASLSAADAEWRSTKWHDEAAWVSTHGKLKAIVSVDRSRLIFFGPAESETNLINAPWPKNQPSEKEISPNWGGLRFWLGPQSRWIWPQPKDWEFSAADQVEAKGAHLILHESHRDPKYPQIVRDYSWDGDRLRCEVRWQKGEQPFYAMHVLPIDLPAEVNVQLQPWEDVPQGFVLIKDFKPVANPPAHPSIELNGSTARLKTGVMMAKFGFAPQPLSARLKGYVLTLSPGPLHGTAVESPDYGYHTQVWVGGPNVTFCEIEQITPFLLPAEDGWCGSTVFVEAKAN